MRTKRKQAPNAILTSDWHLREDTPSCRTDDYFKAMEKKIQFINDLSIKHHIPILIAGDLFHKSKSSPALLRWAIDMLKQSVLAVAGQHDLPHHNYGLFDKSNMAVLCSAKRVINLPCNSDNGEWIINEKFTVWGFPWGTPLATRKFDNYSDNQIALCHTLAYEKKPWPDAPDSGNAKAIMKKLKGFDLIVTGDNHQPFIMKSGKQLLVNPGSLMRMSADQMEHKPRVYLWYADTNEVEAVYLPIEEGVVTRQHIERVEERDERMAAFVRRLDDDFSVELSFEENLKKYFQVNRTSRVVEKLVWEAIDGR